MRRLLLLVIVVVSAGCYRETIRIDDPDGTPPPWDAGFVLPTSKCLEPAGMDLLFVIDDSHSMAEEQESLAAQLPAFVRALLSPPDEDMDGEPDWLPITDLHVGVVTTDLGVGVPGVPTCDQLGDDGLLRTSGNPGAPCQASYPSFLSYDGTGSPDQLALDLGCVARAGTAGCGFEQPLEAMLKALSPAHATDYTGPSYTPPTFRGGAGHGDGANAGFLRSDTLLAVVVLADEDDCSASDTGLYDPTSSTYTAELNLRCFRYPDAVHPITRYIEGLAALRHQRPDLLALAVIAGVPGDLATDSPTDTDFLHILDDARMQEQVAPTGSMLTPSCDVPGRGSANPPRRLVELARGLGRGRATVQSICDDDYTAAAGAIARLFGERACQTFER